MSKCKYWKKCFNYRKDSFTCGYRREGSGYCGQYEILEEKAKRNYGFFNPIKTPTQEPTKQLNVLFEKLDRELNRFCDDDEVVNKIKSIVQEIKKEVLD